MRKWIFTTLLSYAQAVTVWGKISIYDLCKLKKTRIRRVRVHRLTFIWDKVFKNGPSEICGTQPLKNLKEYDLLTYSNFLKTAFHKFYLIHSWILCPICPSKIGTEIMFEIILFSFSYCFIYTIVFDCGFAINHFFVIRIQPLISLFIFLFLFLN